MFCIGLLEKSEEEVKIEKISKDYLLFEITTNFKENEYGISFSTEIKNDELLTLGLGKRYDCLERNEQFPFGIVNKDDITIGYYGKYGIETASKMEIVQYLPHKFIIFVEYFADTWNIPYAVTIELDFCIDDYI